MRINSKGQVTIPADLREKAGLAPNTEVAISFDGVSVRVEPTSAGTKSRGAILVAHLRGSGDVKLSTDEIMAFTRGDIEDV